MNASVLARLRDIVGPEAVLSAGDDCWPYGYDNSRRHHAPDYVALPREHAEVMAIVTVCNEHSIPITCRGLGTGTTGASVPISGGLVLSTERMDRIQRIDPDNRLAVVQPGVTNQALQDAVAAHGFFWPPDPTSAAYCTVGGNLAYNSAGPRAVKYGTPRENTLGLLAVTGDGRELRCGVHTSKGVVGYDLTRLLIGSEGTLAIITEAIIKLVPLPEDRITLQAVYRDIQGATRAVSDIMARPVTPCALEFIDGNAIDMIRGYTRSALPEQAGAMLMIEVDGPRAGLEQAAAAVIEAASNGGLLSIEQARSEEQVQALWATRKALSPALRTVAPKKINEDVVVPVAAIPELISGLDELAATHDIRIINFGHAGNGNIHVNLLIDPEDPDQSRRAEQCLNQVFDLVISLQGSLSGEHGVGLEKMPFVDKELSPVSLDLMAAVKKVFDPRGLLNPGKMFPQRRQ